MNKTTFSQIALMLLVLVSIAACKKDKEENRTDLLTDENWRTTALTVDPAINIGGVVVSDLYAQLDDCEKDDLTIFKTDGKVNYDEGATKCDPSDPQTSTGTWTFNTDQTIITIDGESWTIEEITSNKLRVKYTADLFGTGVNSTIRATFVH